MKRLLSLASLVLIVVAQGWPQNAEHLDRPILRNLRTATPTFDSIFVASGQAKRVKVSFLNTGPDTLVIGKGADTASINTNYQYNGTFETDSSGWSFSATDSIKTTEDQYHGGSKSLEVVATGEGALITSQLIQNRTAERWTNTAWVMVGLEATDTTVYIELTDRYGTLLAIDTTELERATWTQISVSATLSGSQTAVRTVIGFGTGVADDTLWVDDVTFKKTTDELIYLAPRMSYVDDAWPLGYLRVRSYGSAELAKYYMVIGGGEFGFAPERHVVSQFADSAGTATVYWQTIDMKDFSFKRVEALNDGAVNISVGLTAADTSGASATTRRTVYPSNGIKFTTAVRYIFIKAASGTCAYRIGTY